MKTINQNQVRHLQFANSAAAEAAPIGLGELVVLLDTGVLYVARDQRTGASDIELDNGRFLFNVSVGGGGGSDASEITYSGTIPTAYSGYDTNVETIIEGLLASNGGSRLLATTGAEEYRPYNPDFLGETFTYTDLGFIQVSSIGNVNGSYRLEYAPTSAAVSVGDALYVSSVVPTGAPATADDTYIVDSIPSSGVIALNRPINRGSSGYPDGAAFRVYKMEYTQPLVTEGAEVIFFDNGIVGYPFPRSIVSGGDVFVMRSSGWEKKTVDVSDSGYGFHVDPITLDRPEGIVTRRSATSIDLPKSLSYTCDGIRYHVPVISNIGLQNHAVQNIHIVSSGISYDLSGYTNSYVIQNVNNSGFDIVVLYGDEGDNPAFSQEESWAMDLAHILMESNDIRSITESFWMASSGSKEEFFGSRSEVLSGIYLEDGSNDTYNITPGAIRSTYGQVTDYAGIENPTVRYIWQDGDNRNASIAADGRYYNVLGTTPDPGETNPRHALIPDGMFSVDFIYVYQRPGSSRDIFVTKGDTLYTAEELSQGIPAVLLNGLEETGYRSVAAVVQQGSGQSRFVAIHNNHDITRARQVSLVVPQLLESLTSQTQFHTSKNLVSSFGYNVSLLNGTPADQRWTVMGSAVSLVTDAFDGRRALRIRDTDASITAGITRTVQPNNLDDLFNFGGTVDYVVRPAEGAASGRFVARWSAADAPVGSTGGQFQITHGTDGTDTTFTISAPGGDQTATFSEVGYFSVHVVVQEDASGSWGGMSVRITPPSGNADAQTITLANWVSAYSGNTSDIIVDTGDVSVNDADFYLADLRISVFQTEPTILITRDDIVNNRIFIADGSREWTFEVPTILLDDIGELPDSATVVIKLLGEGSYRIRRNASDIYTLVNGAQDVTGTYSGNTVIEVITDSMPGNLYQGYIVTDITSSGGGIVTLPPISAADVSYDASTDSSSDPLTATDVQSAVNQLNTKIQQETLAVQRYGLEYNDAITMVVSGANFSLSAINARLPDGDLIYNGDASMAHGMAATDNLAVIGIANRGSFTAPNSRYSVINSGSTATVDVVIKRSNFLTSQDTQFSASDLGEVVYVGYLRRVGGTITSTIGGLRYGDGTLNEYITREASISGGKLSVNGRGVSLSACSVTTEAFREFRIAEQQSLGVSMLVPVSGTSQTSWTRTVIANYQWSAGGSTNGDHYFDTTDDAIRQVPDGTYIVDTIVMFKDASEVFLIKYVGLPLAAHEVYDALIEDYVGPFQDDVVVLGKVVYGNDGIVHSVVQRGDHYTGVPLDVVRTYTQTSSAGDDWAISGPGFTADEFASIVFTFNGMHLRNGYEVSRTGDNTVSITYDSVIDEDHLELTRT